MYSDIDGVKRKLTQQLYSETEIDDIIVATDPEVIAWVNASIGATIDFTEDQLIGSDDIIRLAANCYAACRIMSETLEGHGIENESLARFRCGEARDYITLWCVNHGIIPSFDGEVYSPVMVEFGYGAGSDASCIG